MRRCGKPTAMAYPAGWDGWMALCSKCSEPHFNEATSIETLLATGETLEKSAALRDFP